MLAVLYVTMPDEDAAVRLSETLVEAELAACTNLLESTSIYRWEGDVVQEDEVAMLVKTRPDLVDDVTERILEEHPYDVPCVIDLGVAAVNDAFGSWVDGETTGTT